MEKGMKKSVTKPKKHNLKSKAARSKSEVEPKPQFWLSGPISPHQLIRRKDGPTVFGYQDTVLRTKIAAGEIPEPFPLTDSGRALFWYGSQVLDWLAKAIEKAPERRRARAKRLVEEAAKNAAKRAAKKKER